MAKGFQCKQFFVAQEHCAMKVGTDSLILGSWAQPEQASRILDVGTGTGILALMMAQKYPAAHITAIDIDHAAVLQAKDNVAASPWAERIAVEASDIKDLRASSGFDIVVCNPPYFQQATSHTQAYGAAKRNRLLARHDDALTPQQLFLHCSRLLCATGKIYCVYPAARDEEIVAAALSFGLHLRQRLRVQATPQHAAYLHGFCFSFQLGKSNEKNLTIRDTDNSYTAGYKALCADFYLDF